MNELFISDGESDKEPPLKKAKAIESGVKSDVDSVSDSDFDSDFEDIPLQPLTQALPTQDAASEFNIAIQSVDDEQRRRLNQQIEDKQRRTSLHYLSIIAYTLHAWQRNNTKSLKRIPLMSS